MIQTRGLLTGITGITGITGLGLLVGALAIILARLGLSLLALLDP